jgi:uncharacterized protein (TIGR00251 family)
VTTPAIPWLREVDAGVALTVRVVPNAPRDEVVGLHGDTLKIRISTPAVEGAANRSLIVFLARTLEVRRQQIHIQSGERSRRKRVHVTGLSMVDALRRLSPLLEE